MNKLTLPISLLLTSSAILCAAEDVKPDTGKLPQTGVTFLTADTDLQNLYDTAEKKEAKSISPFTPTMKVLVEGGGYTSAFIETQPVGGEMYAQRDVEIALNNQMVFMLNQRADGRLPGWWASDFSKNKDVFAPGPHYLDLQGYCFPDPAWKTYFWIGKDKDYLAKLYHTLEAYDANLWRTRNPKGDGLLQIWCTNDTGEDHSPRFRMRGATGLWPLDKAPGTVSIPKPKNKDDISKYWVRGSREILGADAVFLFASMDINSYSYDGRATLAKIPHELGNRREAFWQQQAEEVRQNVIKGLWDEERHACFDHDKNGKQLPELIHNILRVMYHGLFTQTMADAFIKYHLLNPAEFWTPMPLPSIAVNELLFGNVDTNDWGGQPQGLTYQRSIRALENYGHYTEVTLLGQKLTEVVIKGGNRFTQQFDPFKAIPTSRKQDGYGTTILSTLEYISRMHGIHLDLVGKQVWWSAIDGTDFAYTQRFGDQTWTLIAEKGHCTAHLNDRELFSCTAGARVVTDLSGSVREIIGIVPTPQSIEIQTAGVSHKLTVKPNQVSLLDGVVVRTVPFDYPYVSKDAGKK
jgi:hypothetical protein